VVLSLPLIRSISSELSASPSSIFNLSTWNQFISEFDYETVSDLFKTLKSLCRVELLVPRLQCNVRQPSDENLTKIGERTIFRAWGKEYVYNSKLARGVDVLTRAGVVSPSGNTLRRAMSVSWQPWQHSCRPRRHQSCLMPLSRFGTPSGRMYSATHVNRITLATVVSAWFATCSW